MTIIANNCAGWRLAETLKEPYKTPTIALQILPEEFPKLCANLKYYMDQRLMEYTHYSEKHREAMIRLLGQEPTFPCGIVGDIAVLFQHEKDFKTAKEKWDRRKERIDYNDLAFVFCLDYKRYEKEAQEMSDLHLPRTFIFTNNFHIPGPHYFYVVPDGLCFLDVIDGRYIFESDFDRGELWRQR